VAGDLMSRVRRRAGAARLAAAERLGSRPSAPAAEPHPLEHDNLYEVLYEQHAVVFDDERAIGDGDFDQFGRVELSILQHHGLHPGSRLLDMGCGTGRLGVHAVPFLHSGSYTGTDISATMLARAATNVAGLDGAEVQLLKQPRDAFPVPDASVDMVCAFSVFTHMEPEDMYRYLVDGRRVIAPDGCFVLSCLPVEIDLARHVFEESASMTFEQRWRGVRSFITSVSTIEAIASWAGWKVRAWHDAERALFPIRDGSEQLPLGQSTVVLESA
jgi:ubiquinone/menaquinone biosynthesis C-methylase UbiE